MIISQTPFRMSFFGGGTDFPEYFKENGGAVISSTFDKYCYVTVRHLPRYFEYRTHLTYSKMEYVNDYTEIEHPLIREAMHMQDMHELRLTYESDLPAKSGLGTSSSFAVGMLNAFYALKGKYIDKKRLADEAIYLERTLCKENGGIQDQIAAAFGGLNRIDFNREGYTVNPIIIDEKRKELLNENLMLFFTGFSRFSSDIQKNARKEMNSNIAMLKEMYQLVDEAEQVLIGKGELKEFGKLMEYSWKMKSRLASNISTDAIDHIYDKAKRAGAIGGKLLGAGGGGFLLFYVEPDMQNEIRKKLDSMLYVPFRLENMGTRIIHFTPETYEETDKAKEERK